MYRRFAQRNVRQPRCPLSKKVLESATVCAQKQLGSPTGIKRVESRGRARSAGQTKEGSFIIILFVMSFSAKASMALARASKSFKAPSKPLVASKKQLLQEIARLEAENVEFFEAIACRQDTEQETEHVQAERDDLAQMNAALKRESAAVKKRFGL